MNPSHFFLQILLLFDSYLKSFQLCHKEDIKKGKTQTHQMFYFDWCFYVPI